MLLTHFFKSCIIYLSFSHFMFISPSLFSWFIFISPLQGLVKISTAFSFNGAYYSSFSLYSPVLSQDLQGTCFRCILTKIQFPVLIHFFNISYFRGISFSFTHLFAFYWLPSNKSPHFATLDHQTLRINDFFTTLTNRAKSCPNCPVECTLQIAP